MTVRIGTARWTDPSLIKSKRLYPPGCGTPEGQMRYYASQFNMVELNEESLVTDLLVSDEGPSHRNNDAMNAGVALLYKPVGDKELLFQWTGDSHVQ